jgi:hypothetical protein
MAGNRIVAVVGARALPEASAWQVAEVVRHFVGRGWGIGSGGARGADAFVLRAVLAAGTAACARSVVFLPGPAPRPDAALVAFTHRGGRVVAGSGTGRSALLARSRALVQASAGVVAFLWGASRGSVYTVREAIRLHRCVAVVLGGGGAGLPAFAGGSWAPCRLGGVAAFRWVPDPEAPDGDPPGRRRSALQRMFVVDDGEPVHALMAHVSALSAGERLWFERGLLAGHTVLVPHEALSDTPASLNARRLARRFRCPLHEAVDLAELFLALDAGPDVVAHYAAEARHRAVPAIIEDLVHLVARLALAEEVAPTDALEQAEALGQAAETIATDGRVTELPAEGDADSAYLGWHALGSIATEMIACARCGKRYTADEDSAEIPACPGCGTPDTWEARQGGAFRALLEEIDACPCLAELAPAGKRLYALALPHEQAGVAWTHYQLRRAALEAAVVIGTEARRLLADVARAKERELPRVGARLYRIQHTGSAVVTAPEWRRIWHAYSARRRGRVA